VNSKQTGSASSTSYGLGEAAIFMFPQSYGNSLPQSKQTMYVDVDSIRLESFGLGFVAVIGKVQW
jgi:hypothetical protein